MIWGNGFTRLALALALWVAVLPGLRGGAQEGLPPRGEVSPAGRHAQVIANGVAAMPAREVAWRVAVARAAASGRATAEERAAGFILADEAPVALSDENGKVLARLAPGEAAWTELGATRTVVSLSGKGSDYYELALAPAASAVEGRGRRGVTLGEPFAAPAGAAFDVDLIRDTLERGEENAIPASEAPMLLLVTRGTVFVTAPSGEISQVEAGGFTQFAGDFVVSGASRAPAAFVVARIGPAVPARLTLSEGGPSTTRIASTSATPAPPAAVRATPASTPLSLPAALTVSIFACPAGMSPEQFAPEACLVAPPGTFLTLTDPATGKPLGVAQALPGAWVWQGLGTGPHTLAVTALPAGFVELALDGRRCCQTGGDVAAPNAELGPGQHALYLFPPPNRVADTLDSDGDRLVDTREVELETDPFAADSDGDAVGDGDEVDFYGSDPLRPDTDGDGLDDAGELLTSGANPLIADTDGDGMDDAAEIAAGSDPRDATSLPATATPLPAATPSPSPTSEATIAAAPLASPVSTPASLPTPSRGVAVLPTVTPGRAARATPVVGATPRPAARPSPEEALDGDGLTTLDEIAIYGTDPLAADSDGDGVGDGDEVAAGTDPRDPGDH